MPRSLWQQQLADSLREPAALARRFGLDPAMAAAVAARYPLAITPHYLALIEHRDDPIGRQCLPDARELATDPTLREDPLAEARHAPVPGLIHRYPDRVVLLAAAQCAVYCRFCTRKRQVGCPALASLAADAEPALDYIARQPAIHDVLLSGGDPLLLEDDRLEQLLLRLRAIPHVETIRIGSRVPVTLPQRVTPRLAALLKKFPPLYLNTHFNHPRELTPAAAEACRLLAEAGVVLGNQSVLLRGVNDAAATLTELFRGLLRLRVRPYYLHQMDLARGTGHFRVRLERGQELLRQLRGPLSGLAIPHYMVDLPGGCGKIPLTPEYVVQLGDRALLRTPDGAVISYANHPRD